MMSGMDATYALLNYLYGPEPLNQMMNVIEWAPHTNPSWDPYAAVFSVSRPICVLKAKR